MSWLAKTVANVEFNVSGPLTMDEMADLIDGLDLHVSAGSAFHKPVALQRHFVIGY
jgi:hypothetical protein